MRLLVLLVSAVLLGTVALAGVAAPAGAGQAKAQISKKKKCKQARHHHGKKRPCRHRKPPKKTPPQTGPGGNVESPGSSAPKEETTKPKEGPPVLDADADGIFDETDNCPNAANPDQADDDGDGIGDACDLCPADPDPDGYCPATPFDVNHFAPDDVKVKLQELVVTATTADGDTAWVMAEEQVRGFKGFSGLELNLSGVSQATAVGNRLFVEGTVRSSSRKVLDVETEEVTSVGAMPTPVSLTAEELSLPANAAELNGLLVKVGELSQSGSTSTTWTMTGAPGSFVVGDRLIGSLPSYPGGHVVITGIADTLASGELLPRSNADIQQEA